MKKRKGLILATLFKIEADLVNHLDSFYRTRATYLRAIAQTQPPERNGCIMAEGAKLTDSPIYRTGDAPRKIPAPDSQHLTTSTVSTTCNKREQMIGEFQDLENRSRRCFILVQGRRRASHNQSQSRFPLLTKLVEPCRRKRQTEPASRGKQCVCA